MKFKVTFFYHCDNCGRKFHKRKIFEFPFVYEKETQKFDFQECPFCKTKTSVESRKVKII